MQDFERKRLESGLESIKELHQECLETIKKKEHKICELKAKITKTEKELSQQIINRGIWEKSIAEDTKKLQEDRS